MEGGMVHETPSSVPMEVPPREVTVPREPPRPLPTGEGRAIKSNGAERGAGPRAPLGSYQSQWGFFSKDDHEAINTAAPVAFNPGSRAI